MIRCATAPSPETEGAETEAGASLAGGAGSDDRAVSTEFWFALPDFLGDGFAVLGAGASSNFADPDRWPDEAPDEGEAAGAEELPAEFPDETAG
jgi:hypothetical protein